MSLLEQLLLAVVGLVIAIGAVFALLHHKLRRMQREVVASARRFSESFHASPVALALCHLETHRIAEVNDGYLKLVGYTREEAIGKTSAELGLYPQSRRSQLVRRLLRNGVIRNHRESYRCRDGSLRDVILAMDLLELDGERYTLTTVIDDTARQRAERERIAIEEQLRQAQKMESLGLLAGGVAHDFNNMLAVISSCNGLLAESTQPGTQDRELVDEIANAVDRSVQLTRQLLAFSRKQVIAPVVLDLNALIKETRKLLRRLVREDIRVEMSLEPELQRVCADPGTLVQVLMNLAVNARDAMPRGGKLAIATRNDGKTVVITVNDTGVGMPEEVRARIFEPFFTTKERGKGTGMGLAVVHGIVDQARGKIEVDSTVGVGTTFRITLPATDAPADLPVEASLLAAHGGETVLVVDDDEYVRAIAAQVLRHRGYTVLEARDGYSAIGVLVDHRVDLLLTDVIMPGMDGRELADSVHANRPDMKVLFMSGYTDDTKVPADALIEKPFRIPALAAKVRQILDGPHDLRVTDASGPGSSGMAAAMQPT